MMPVDAWVAEDPTACPVCGRDSCEDHLPAPPTPVTAPTHDDDFARVVEREYVRERARREAHLRLDRETRGPIVVPEFIPLRTALTRPRPSQQWRIEQWQPRRANVMLASQYKGGKTTMIANLLRSLVDGDDFLGQSAATPIAGTVVLLDTEMPQHTLEAWLEDQHIVADDRIVALALKGSLSTFDLLDDSIRSAWVARLLEFQTKYLILDNVRPVLDVHGLDEHRDAGRVLVALDTLLRDAQIDEACLVHHMGHVGERARGDSRLRDWPDVEWRIVRQDDNPASARYISAYGRDVEIPESQLMYDRATRRLTVAAGTRKDALLREDLARVRIVIGGSDESLSGRGIKQRLVGRVSDKRVDAALRHGLETEILEAFPGPKRSTLYRLTSSVSVFPSVSPMVATQASVDVFPPL